MSERRVIYVLLRMRYWKLVSDPEVYEDYEEATELFEEYTRCSWEDVEALSEESGADPDQLLGGAFAGSRILAVEIPCACARTAA